MLLDPDLDVLTPPYLALNKLVVRRRPVRALRQLIDTLPADAAESLTDLGRAIRCLDMRLPYRRLSGSPPSRAADGSGRVDHRAQVHAGLAEYSFDGAECQPVDHIIAVDNPVPACPAVLDDLDAPAAVGRLNRSLDHRIHAGDATSAQLTGPKLRRCNSWPAVRSQWRVIDAYVACRAHGHVVAGTVPAMGELHLLL
jgi:hypothetical protein